MWGVKLLKTVVRTCRFLTKEIASGMLYIFLKMLPIKSWARQMLEGLVYLHEHDPRVIHRNLKRDIVFVNGRL